MVDGVPIWDLVRDLRRIKLQKRDREFILQMEARGARVLTPDQRARVRDLARKHSVALGALWTAREAARRSIAKERMGLTDADIEQKRADRLGAGSDGGFGF